jgi:small subunit ribosomal protein S8
MAVSDFLADGITRIRNAQNAKHDNVKLPVSGTLISILEILKKEGFIETFSIIEDGNKRTADVALKYHNNKPVIRGITRISKPGRRVYHNVSSLETTRNNIGITIYSTPKGVITDKEARFQHVGGEILFKVW